MCSHRLRLLRSHSVIAALIALAVLPERVAAQDRTIAALGREQVQFADRVALSSTLEITLLGVEGITDAQRDLIEALEQELRDRVAQYGEPIRRARRQVRLGWPSEPELIEREVNAIAAVRQAIFARVREILLPSQYDRFDRNLLMIGDFDIDMWFGYAKPFTGTTTVGSSVP